MSRKSGIVNVRMVITEEKILSNIDKVKKMINPNSKKQIVQLDEDAFFKDLIESVKAYLIEYPKKKNFPASVYRAAYDLVEYATNQFEVNTKRIEELIRQREQNIALAGELREYIEIIENKEDGWTEKLSEAEGKFSDDIMETLDLISKTKSKKAQNYQDGLKLLNARVNNLESNLHIEIDMERIEDKSKALSYIGIEVADALKVIPTPVEEVKEVEENITETTSVNEIIEEVASTMSTVEENVQENIAAYREETTFETKPSIWQKIKNSKIARAVKTVFKIRIKIEVPNALPEGRGE